MNLPEGTKEIPGYPGYHITKDGDMLNNLNNQEQMKSKMYSVLYGNICGLETLTDAMNGVSIKELQMIPALMNMHPANVLLAGDDIGITSDVMITKEAAIALNCYINDPRQFDEAEQPA